MKKTTYFIAIFIALCFQAYAQITLNPVSATTTFTGVAGTELINTYNGVGLDTYPSLTANHSTTDNAGNCFVASTITGTIDFDFGSTYDIVGVSFWNQNAGGPSTDTGVNGVNFYSSTDGISYTLIPGAPTVFAEVFTGDNSPPEVFTFSAVSARYIRLEVLTNHGDSTESGFAEIAFATTGPTLSIDTVYNHEFDLSLYPNPARDYISISGLKNSNDYIIYNILGAEVLKGNVKDEEKINIQNLRNGVYMMRLSNSNTFKFIKR